MTQYPIPAVILREDIFFISAVRFIWKNIHLVPNSFGDVTEVPQFCIFHFSLFLYHSNFLDPGAIPLWREDGHKIVVSPYLRVGSSGCTELTLNVKCPLAAMVLLTQDKRVIVLHDD